MEWEQYLYGETKLKPNTIKGYIRCIKRFFELGNDELNEADYSKFLHQFTKEKRMPYYYDILIKFTKWRFKNNRDKRNSILKTIKTFGKINYPPKKKPGILDKSQLLMIAESFDEFRFRVITKIMIYTGVRIGDVLRLKDHPSSNNSDIMKDFIIDKETEEPIEIYKITFTQKGDKKNVIPIFNKQLIDELWEYQRFHQKDSEYIFCIRDYNIDKTNPEKVEFLNYYHYWKELKKVCSRLGIDPKSFAPHDYRRNFADKAWEKLGRKDINKLKELMNHSDVNTTLRYLRGTGKDKEDLFREINED